MQLLPLILVLVYGTVAVALILKRRHDFRLGKQVEIDPLYASKAAAGKTVPQMFSFVLTILLLVILVIMGLSLGLSYFDSFSNLGADVLGGLGEELSGLAVILLFLLIPLTPFTIIVNCFWIYSNRIMFAETHSQAPLVKIQKVTAWVAWLIYLVGGWLIVASFYVSMAGVTVGVG